MTRIVTGLQSLRHWLTSPELSPLSKSLCWNNLDVNIMYYNHLGVDRSWHFLIFLKYSNFNVFVFHILSTPALLHTIAQFIGEQNSHNLDLQ